MCNKIKSDQKDIINPVLKLEEQGTLNSREAGEKLQEALMNIFLSLREMFSQSNILETDDGVIALDRSKKAAAKAQAKSDEKEKIQAKKEPAKKEDAKKEEVKANKAVPAKIEASKAQPSTL